MTTQQPIGIFDSGIGGTSIWKEIHTLLANENTIYLSDSKNAPYGQKSTEEILALSIKNTEFLISKGCKIIVVACNTATTNAIEYLRRNYPIPIIGIEPAIKTASIQTKTGTIGILATQGTLNSRLFEKTSASINSDIVIMEQVGNGLVQLIENGKMYSAEMTILLKKHLSLMLSSKCDCIVLGCTHYPYLIPQIKKIVGNTVHIIDSGEAVAKQTKKILAENNLINTSKINTYNTFYVNKDKSVLDIILKDYKNVTVNFLEF
ncbi:glutamate racemase [Tenacibaculum finnmarkense]|uniref:glutamate racemase n=1 Tax=Tenacibaculum finnmarkense TaxID=2781243 RepID=UPI001EFBBE88|nr:glutamate racemase [Tenacibaculum finnmarkense]MCG8795595.1 glutamate racemase [Tenacibaculum finnmarkense]MCG8798043.1 glutamate racemase [Tenacibaculum finnmarkense]